jgi:hypothetical protein
LSQWYYTRIIPGVRTTALADSLASLLTILPYTRYVLLLP